MQLVMPVIGGELGEEALLTRHPDLVDWGPLAAK